MLTGYMEFKNYETEGAVIIGFNLEELKEMLTNKPFQIDLKTVDPELPNISIILFAEVTDELLVKRIHLEVPGSRGVPIEVED